MEGEIGRTDHWAGDPDPCHFVKKYFLILIYRD